MADEFLSEINEVVSSAEVGKVEPSVTTTVTDDNKVEVGKPDNEVENRLLSLMESPAEKEAAKAEKERKTLSLKPKEEAKPADDKPADDAAQQKPAEDEKSKLPYLDRFLRQDEEGNLVIGNGTVIAAKGPARVYYENIKKEGRDARAEAERLAVSNFELSKKFKELFTEYNQIKDSPATKSLETQTGMTSQEVNDAVNLMKQYKSDPITAIKSLLTQARLRGIDLNSIGINGGIDPATLQRSFDAALNERFAKLQEQPTQQTVSKETAEQEATAFLEAFPEAIEHAEIIGKAKDRFPEKPLEQIWLEFRIWQRNQLARQQEQEQQQPAQKPAQQQQQRPATRVVTKPKSYEQMTYAEIARDIEENGV